MDTKNKKFILEMTSKALLVLICSSSTTANSMPVAQGSNQSMPMANKVAPVVEAEAILNARFPFAGLSLVPAPVLKQLANNEGEIEFGQVSALDAPQLERTFQLKNAGKAPVTIERLQTSCHCTSAFFETPTGSRASDIGASKTYTSQTLRPGQTATVRVRIDLAQLTAGSVVKSVFVYLKGNSQPAAFVTLSGELRSSLTLWPQKLDFGQVPMGSPRTLTITTTFDPRLAAPDALPMLVSSDPDIQVAPAPKTLAAVGDVPGQRNLKNAPLQQTYLITLSASSAGPVSSVLSFAPTVPRIDSMAAKTKMEATARTKQPISAKTDTSTILARISVPVQGEVVGDVAAEPSALALGPVPGQRSAVGRVMLTVQNADALAGAVMSSPSPYVSAKIQTVQPLLGGGGANTLPGSRMLEVTISPKAPLGLMQTTVIVTLTNGQRLHIPISAYIISPNAL